MAGQSLPDSYPAAVIVDQLIDRANLLQIETTCGGCTSVATRAVYADEWIDVALSLAFQSGETGIYPKSPMPIGSTL